MGNEDVENWRGLTRAPSVLAVPFITVPAWQMKRLGHPELDGGRTGGSKSRQSADRDPPSSPPGPRHLGLHETVRSSPVVRLACSPFLPARAKLDEDRKD